LLCHIYLLSSVKKANTNRDVRTPTSNRYIQQRSGRKKQSNAFVGQIHSFFAFAVTEDIISNVKNVSRLIIGVVQLEDMQMPVYLFVQSEFLTNI